MMTDLARLQKKVIGDGPAERQVLLLKILHEFGAAPPFGEKYVADANSPPQQWIARIGALMSRSGLQHQMTFQSLRRTSIQYWPISREPFRQLLSAVAEEIKLELELEGRDNIGQVYSPNHQYDFLRDLKEIIIGATREVFVIDPYFDGSAFEIYVSPIGGTCSIKILCSRYSSDLVGHKNAYSAQHASNILLKRSNDLHDRLVIIDNTDCWIVGASIKDAGKKPTYLIPLQPAISAAKITIYQDIWSQADPIA